MSLRRRFYVSSNVELIIESSSTRMAQISIDLERLAQLVVILTDGWHVNMSQLDSELYARLPKNLTSRRLERFLIVFSVT